MAAGEVEAAVRYPVVGVSYLADNAFFGVPDLPLILLCIEVPCSRENYLLRSCLIRLRSHQSFPYIQMLEGFVFYRSFTRSCLRTCKGRLESWRSSLSLLMVSEYIRDSSHQLLLSGSLSALPLFLGYSLELRDLVRRDLLHLMSLFDDGVVYACRYASGHRSRGSLRGGGIVRFRLFSYRL